MSNLSRAIGIPLKINQATINGDFGHFARVLVDINLKNPLLEAIQLEKGEECRFVNLFYEKLPDFCTTYSSIGHVAARCYHNAPKGDASRGDKELTKKQVGNDIENVANARPKPTQVYRPKENVVSLSNAFNTLNKDLNAADQIVEPSSKGHNEITHVVTGLNPIVKKDDDVNANNVDMVTEFNEGTEKDEQVNVVHAEVAKDMEKDDVLYEGENQV